MSRLRPPCQWQARSRIALGVATAWPPVYMVLFVGFITIGFFLQKTADGEDPFKVAFAVLFLVHMLTILLGFVLLGAYLFDAFRNPRVAPDNRVLWVLLVALVGLFAMPVYWYLFLKPSLPVVPADNSSVA